MSIELDLIDALNNELNRAWGIDSALHGLAAVGGSNQSLTGILTLQNDHIDRLIEIKEDLHKLFHEQGKVADPPEDDDEDEDDAAA
jgi:hypothetical protein